jgi:hypothetical protein
MSTNQEIYNAGKLVKKSVLLATRKEGFHTVLLYQLENNYNYLEVYCHEHFNVIIKVNTFSDTSHLEPYLDQIDISGLL